MRIIGETVQFIIYIGLTGGIVVLFLNSFSTAAMRIRLRRRLVSKRIGELPKGRVVAHLDKLVKSTVSEKLKAGHLICALALSFVCAFAVSARNFGTGPAVFIGLSAALILYMALVMRLEGLRHRASFEGEAFAAMLLSKYRISGRNMQQAIELIIAEESAPKQCRKVLTSILLTARTTGDPEAVRRLFDEFRFAVNTNWSRMAAYNMALSFTSGIDVTDALESLVIRLREARQLTEERKRLNSEAGRLVLFMVPVTYAASLFLAVKYVGIDMKTLLSNQFGTPEGFALFVAIVFMFFLNSVLLSIVGNKRFDY